MKKSTIYKFYFLFCPINPNNILDEFSLLNKVIGCNAKFRILHKKCATISQIHYAHFYNGSRCSNMQCISEKIKKVKLEKYGDSSYNNREKFKETYKTYSPEKKHKSHANSTLSLNDRSYNNLLKRIEKVNIQLLIPREEYYGIDKGHSYQSRIFYPFKCLICGNEFMDNIWSHTPKCIKCHPRISGISNQEKDVMGWIENNISKEFLRNKRFYKNKKPYFEMDIYFKDKNKCILYHGDYWHCNPIRFDKDYFHKNTKLFAWQKWEHDKKMLERISEFNIDCLIIWEYDWKTNRIQVENNIKLFLLAI
jgi:G:T-mismatch repair DNA endonuclease (very short patch repair protein)